MPLIQLDEVSKVFGFGDATTLALDEVNLSVEKGEFVAIMGPSGCGKTTLMNIIGLLDSPTFGHYNLGGRAVSRLKPNVMARLRRDEIGFVFQFYNLIPNLSVLENTALPLAYRGMTPVRRLKRASDMLERVGIRDREYFMPRHISGGQLQRAAIARALINDPSILIADEPTGNLDSHDTKVVMELLADLHRQGNTIMMVTHNPELTRYASRIIYMKDGTIVEEEKSRIGDVAPGALKTYLRKRKTTRDDVAAGVSALMKDIPDAAVKSDARKKTKRKKRRSIRRKK
jgi:putative ABC transport system ATP-binding protein